MSKTSTAEVKDLGECGGIVEDSTAEDAESINNAAGRYSQNDKGITCFPTLPNCVLGCNHLIWAACFDADLYCILAIL